MLASYPQSTAVDLPTVNRALPDGIILHSRPPVSTTANGPTTTAAEGYSEEDRLRRARVAVMRRRLEEAWEWVEPLSPLTTSKYRKEAVDTVLQIAIERVLSSSSSSSADALARIAAQLQPWMVYPDVLASVVPAKHFQATAKLAAADPWKRALAAIALRNEALTQAADWCTLAAVQLMYVSDLTLPVDTLIAGLDKPRCVATWRRFADIAAASSCASVSGCLGKAIASYTKAALVPCLEWRDRPVGATTAEIRRRARELPLPLFDGHSVEASMAYLMSGEEHSSCAWCSGSPFSLTDETAATALESTLPSDDLSKRMAPCDTQADQATKAAWLVVRRRRFFRRFFGQHVLVLFGGLHGRVAQEGVRRVLEGIADVDTLFDHQQQQQQATAEGDVAAASSSSSGDFKKHRVEASA